jgi:ubiquinone/menaquinone biosynthesis C-methylase UbiE
MPSVARTRTGNIYTDLADYYDLFCAEVDYTEQCTFARRVFSTFAQSGGMEYLDLACGSGQHMQIMQHHGFVPQGLDNSAEMLALAAQRCPDADLHLCDLAAFTQQDNFDLITCFLYSIHYSHPLDSLQQTLQRSFTALKPGGVLLFNAVDARGIQNDAGITTHLALEDAQLSFRSAWHYRGEGEVLDLRLEISRRTDDLSEQWQDGHVMTALTFRQLQALLLQAGFETQMLEHNYSTMQAWDGKSFNALVVACKPMPVK